MPAVNLRTVATIVLAAAVVLGSGASAVSAGTGVAAAPGKGILPPKNPSRSVNPDPDFFAARSCAGGGDSAACNTIVLRAITHARQVLERFGGMSFLAVRLREANARRAAFRDREPGAHRARPAASAYILPADTDPPLNQVPGTLPGGGRWVSLGGNWAGGFDNPLGADYGWMYDDKAEAWGHRDNILVRYVTASSCGGLSREIAMGAGHVARGKAYGDSETELFAGVCGRTPTDVVLTWSQAKKLLHIT